jgi:nucleoside-diphosphate-sugar epimerase
MKTHVLVTGGAGYLGSILCEHLLRAEYRVTVLDSLLYGQSSLFHLCAHPDFDFVRGDVRDEETVKPLVQKADVLIPLAAVVGAPACQQDPWLARSVNLEAVSLLNRLRSPRQLVVFPNTNSGYGASSGETFCTEESPLRPISLYGQTKVKAEEILLQSGNAIVLRLATVFGMSPRLRLDLLVNHFVYAALKERYLVIFEKDFKRNYVHIRDVADCFLYCLGHAPRMIGKPFNLGLDAANLSKAELAEKIKTHISDFYIHYAEVGSDPDRRNYIVSNRRLQDAGFAARRSLDEGIQELMKGYRMMGRGAFGNV